MPLVTSGEDQPLSPTSNACGRRPGTTRRCRPPWPLPPRRLLRPQPRRQGLFTTAFGTMASKDNFTAETKADG
ncbi:hypothetical protein CHLRE_12g545703v5 [Chlamydomonas reinhardtii]|uniref:Uncharacterized protein n=1 Tax=Chlamydomonas reinhardtii TaxID=3055 RepID=A0A2K3D6J6_CHLRE|nr:uncharacterized protein CHLRE_12g545703v5 [Chlamydomonas reinhardtii]PNW76153.1 hypothetical protein CHLRE_12g545703v5 [Chlamydomonas reinhardtii]